MVGCASVSVWVQAGQCAGMATRPGQRLLVAMRRKAVVTANAACSAEGGACLEGVGATDGCMVRLTILLHAACPAWLLFALSPSAPVQIS